MRIVKCNLYPYSRSWNTKWVRSRYYFNDIIYTYSSNWNRDIRLSWYYIWTYSICFNKHYVYSRLGSLK